MAGFSPFSRALAVFALAGAAACSDAVTAPSADLSTDAIGAPSFARGEGHLRTGKYRDSGAPHATGRSGSAVLSARAVLRPDGVVRLLVTTGDLDDPRSAPGELAKVQLKVFSPDGTLLSTENHLRPTSGGSHEFLLPGLEPGSTIRVQANVRGIDRRRTDVVTLTETVRLPPSLSALLDPLPGATPGMPTLITATIAETGGEVGAYTTCTLYVDGVEVDRIENVWVDAGDEVSCAFTYTFEREGTYEVTVTAGDPSEVGALLPPPTTGTLDVVDPTVATYRASVLDRTAATRWIFEQSWWKPDGTSRAYRHDNGEASRAQTASLAGTLSRAAVLPLAGVRLRIWSTEGPWQTASWSGVDDVVTDADGRACVNRFVPEHGGHFHLCTLDGTTAYGYTRFSGTVTYHSRGSIREWGGPAGTETLWTWNEEAETYSTGGQHRPLGTAVTMTLEIDDAAGSLGASAVVPITALEGSSEGGERVCREESPWWLEGGVMTTCESRSARVFGWRGEVKG